MRSFLTVAVFTTAWAGHVHAGQLVLWDFQTVTAGGAPPQATIQEGLSTHGIWFNGFDDGGASYAKGVMFHNNKGNHGKNRDYSENNNLGIYFDLIIAAGEPIDLTGLQTPWFWERPGGKGNNIEVFTQWQYSITDSSGNSLVTWADIGGEEKMPYDNASGGFTGYYGMTTLDFSNIDALQGLEDVTVTFRLLLWGGEHNARAYLGKDAKLTPPGLDYFPNSLIIFGGPSVPEPSAMAFLVLSGATLLLRRRTRRTT